MGAGIGLCFTPLTSTVLANVDPARAGGASGALSTTQQVGFALGVAITGVIYFGAADGGIAHAFELSLIQLAVVAAGIVVVSRLFPGFRTHSGIKPHTSQQIADTVVDTAWNTPGSTSRRTWTAMPSCTPASISPRGARRCRTRGRGDHGERFR